MLIKLYTHIYIVACTGWLASVWCAMWKLLGNWQKVHVKKMKKGVDINIEITIDRGGWYRDSGVALTLLLWHH